MSLLNATHLPLLEAKLLELDALAIHISSSRRDVAFKRHYTRENGLNQLAYDVEVEQGRVQTESEFKDNYNNKEDLKVAIAECKKHISITNALNLIGG